MKSSHKSKSSGGSGSLRAFGSRRLLTLNEPMYRTVESMNKMLENFPEKKQKSPFDVLIYCLGLFIFVVVAYALIFVIFSFAERGKVSF